MTDQRTLFKPGPADGNLTDRQQLVLEILEQHPAGIRALDIGIALHQALSKPCPCRPGHACKWAPTDALQVLRSLRKRELAIGRKTGLWQLTATSRSRPSLEGREPEDAYDPAAAPIPF